MLIIALVLALIGLAALVFAVVTSSAAVAWVCIGASALGVLLLIIDALRERRRERSAGAPVVERVKAERVKVRQGEVAGSADATDQFEPLTADDETSAGATAEAEYPDGIDSESAAPTVDAGIEPDTATNAADTATGVDDADDATVIIGDHDDETSI